MISGRSAFVTGTRRCAIMAWLRALIVRSLERAVEVGRSRATLGGSLPFLGKGSVWFKVKWGGVITWDTAIPDMRMFMDLRNAGVRRMLPRPRSSTPREEAWWCQRGSGAGTNPLKTPFATWGGSRVSPAGTYLGEPQTLDAAAAQLSANERIVPLPVSLHSDDPPLWLGEMLPR